LILGTGVDLAEVRRIREAVERYGERFLHRIYTPGEIAYVERKANKFERYAGRFAAKEAGMKGLILTAKHHDGFCLWPSKYTKHSIKHSPWKNGRGDVVKEMSAACRKYGLKFGIYLSPWDRNHPDYGRPAYLTYFRNQLRELLTNYGPVFEVFLDGANGGDGFYGGARETRRIDRETFYDWPTTWQMIRGLQPAACLFSDAGPDVRWVGNERGSAGETARTGNDERMAMRVLVGIRCVSGFYQPTLRVVGRGKLKLR